jgi:glucosamine-6-phosphate deaminase
MEIVIVDSAQSGAAIVANAVERLAAIAPSPTLGLATGSSPLEVYRELIARVDGGSLRLANTTCFLLDEYVGLAHDHPQSYHSFIRREFTDHTDIADDAVLGPETTSSDLATAGERYEAAIRGAGGIDLQLLGIGSDGHIGFNEPSSSLGSRTRLKTLTEETRKDNARFFDGDVAAVPRYALTQGIGTILEARHLVLLANGAKKAEAVAAAVEGPLTASLPASALQLHPHATLVIDEPAASLLERKQYYRATYDAKPDWQEI